MRKNWVCTYCGARQSGEQPSNDGCREGPNGKHLWISAHVVDNPYALVRLPDVPHA
jgi:hypothetical protein